MVQSTRLLPEKPRDFRSSSGDREKRQKKNRSLPGNKEGWQAWIYMWILVLKAFIYNTLNDRNETLLFTDCKLTQTLASPLIWWSLEIRTVVGKINRTRIIVISNGLNLEACSTVAWENNWHFMMPQFPCKMMSEKQVQKFHTDEASLPDLSIKCFWLAEANFLCGMTNQKHYSDLHSDESSVRNFCARFSDVISWGNGNVASQNVSCFLRLTLLHPIKYTMPTQRCVNATHCIPSKIILL